MKHENQRLIRGSPYALQFLPDSHALARYAGDGSGAEVIITDAKMLNFILSDEGIIPMDLIISQDQSLAKDNSIQIGTNITIDRFSQMQQLRDSVVNISK